MIIGHKISSYKYNIYIAALISLLFSFRSISTYFRINNIVYVILIAVTAFNFLNLLYTGRFRASRHSVSIVLFVFWGGIMLIFGLFFIDPAVVSLVGFTGTYFYLIYWWVLLNTIEHGQIASFLKKFINIQQILGVLIALGAIYQYFFDQSLFNFNYHIHFSNLEMIYSGQITKRATSFIGSPQMLGFYMFYLIGLAMLVYNKNSRYGLQWGMIVIFMIAGLLSGSAAFLGSLLIFILSYLLLKQNKLKAV